MGCLFFFFFFLMLKLVTRRSRWLRWYWMGFKKEYLNSSVRLFPRCMYKKNKKKKRLVRIRTNTLIVRTLCEYHKRDPHKSKSRVDGRSYGFRHGICIMEGLDNHRKWNPTSYVQRSKKISYLMLERQMKE